MCYHTVIRKPLLFYAIIYNNWGFRPVMVIILSISLIVHSLIRYLGKCTSVNMLNYFLRTLPIAMIRIMNTFKFFYPCH